MSLPGFCKHKPTLTRKRYLILLGRLASTSSAPYREPTIFAPATGRSKSAIAILRISGPDSLEVWGRMTRAPRPNRTPVADSDTHNATIPPKPSLYPPKGRRATLRRIVHPFTGEVLDDAVVLYFPENSSLTGQKTLEIHTHGSPALMSLLLQTLPLLSPSFRIAEPGEFTRLALEAGKMDLTEVEGIRDLVEAQTETQRKLAARQAQGHMRDRYEAMRSSLIEATALIEALIDFGEDEHISDEIFDQAKSKVRSLQKLINTQLQNNRKGEIIRNGIQLAIIGPPNAGKSSLFNWLAQRDAAIVSSIPGTTRDVVEISLDLYGFPISLADTAGLRETGDEIEALGVERARQRASIADFKICILSATDIQDVLLNPNVQNSFVDLIPFELIDSNTLVLINKVDSVNIKAADLEAVSKLLVSKCPNLHASSPLGPIAVSVKTGEGLDLMVYRTKEILASKFDLTDDLDSTPLVTHERHRRHLQDCSEALESFLAKDASDIVFAAEDLRYAIISLGSITGAVDVEEVLGEIFRGFCIGK